MNKRRQLKPRTAVYDNETHGRGDSTMPFDDMTLNEKACRMRLIRPGYNDPPMIMRPWPALDYDDPDKFVPGRKSLDPELGMSHWLCRVTAAKFIGIQKQGIQNSTFLLYQPGDREAKNNNPYRQLYFACKDAEKNARFGDDPHRPWDANWNRLMKGGEGRGAPISRPKDLWFMQGVVFSNRDTCYVDDRNGVAMGCDPNDELVIIQVTGGTSRDGAPMGVGERLLSILGTKNQNPVDDAEKPWESFYYGDPCGFYDATEDAIRGGLIFEVFNPRWIEEHQPENVKKAYTVNSTWDGKLKEFQGYDVKIRRSWKSPRGVKCVADMSQQATELAFNKWRFWFDDPNDPDSEPGILRFPSVEEQCVFIAKAFIEVPMLLRYAWADHPDFFTEDVEGILTQRRSAVVPGTAGEVQSSGSGGSGGPAPSAEQRERKPRTDPTQAGAFSGAGDDEFSAAGQSASTDEQVEEEDEFSGDDSSEPGPKLENDEFVGVVTPSEREAAEAASTPAADDDVSPAGDNEFEEDTQEPAPVGAAVGADPDDSIKAKKAEIAASLEAAKQRSGKRGSPAPGRKGGGKGGKGK